MDTNTINVQFSKVIESLGYSQEDLQKYLKIFDLPKKIQTITSTYTLTQRKDQISICLNELKSRNSLFYLLFLKNTLETMFQLSESVKAEVWEKFIALNGIEVLWHGFNSNNSDFLTNLLEIIILLIGRNSDNLHKNKSLISFNLDVQFNSENNCILNERNSPNIFLLKILPKFELVDKKIFYRFLNIEINRVYLLLSPGDIGSEGKATYNKEYFQRIYECIKANTVRCYCNTFLKRIVEEIFTKNKIGEELNFLIKNDFELSKLIEVNTLARIQSNFEDQRLYQELFNSLKIRDELLEITEKLSLKENGKNSEINGKVELIDYKAKEETKIKPMGMGLFGRKEDNPSTDSKLNEEKEIKVELKVKPMGMGLFGRKQDKDLIENENYKLNEEKEIKVDMMVKPKGFGLFGRKQDNPSTESKSNEEKDVKVELKVKPMGMGLFSEKQEIPTQENKVEIKVKPMGMGLFGKKQPQPDIKEFNLQSNSNLTESKIKNVNKQILDQDITKNCSIDQVTENSSSIGDYSISSEVKSVKPKGFGLFSKLNSSEAAKTPIPTQETPQKPKFSFGSRAKSFKPTLISEKIYRGIKWKKTSKSVIQIFSKINYETAEKAFKLTEFDQFENKTAKKEIKSKETTTVNQKITLMDPKKSYALNIALGRVKMNNEELITSISNGSFDNENLIKQLILYYPSQEEFEQICKIRKEDQNIGRAEMLFYLVLQHNSNTEIFLNSLLALRFKCYFKNRNYIEIINKIAEKLKRILESQELVNLFGNLLVIGNVLNSNSFNGNAEGFTLDSFNSFTSKEILELISNKINLEKLFKELDCESNRIELLNTPISIETLIFEINEAKTLFGEFVDGNTEKSFKETLDRYEDFNRIYKEVQMYFGENNDGFIGKLEEFLREINNRNS